MRHYAVLVAALMVAALGSGRPEALALAAPLLTLLVTGILLARPPRLDASATLDRTRVLEGERIGLHLVVHAASRPAEIVVRVPIGQELRSQLTSPQSGEGHWGSDLLTRFLRPNGDVEELDADIDAPRWGGHRIRALRLTAHDRLGFFRWQTDVPVDLDLRVYPRPETVRRLLPPLETQPAAGPNLSRARGEGIELADISAYEPGDQLRRVNWRASARRPHLMVNRLHPDRSSDVILFLDSYAEIGRGEHSSVVTSVRVAAALAQAHLQHRDRVGVIGWGGVLRWLLPASGTAQVYRILDVLVDTQVQVSYAWRAIAHVPARTLPANAQILAVTPLADERSIDALLDLAARGRDLAVVEIAPAAFIPPPANELEQLALRVYELRRILLRDRFVASGVPLATWMPDRPLTALLGQLEAFRRSARIRRPA